MTEPNQKQLKCFHQVVEMQTPQSSAFLLFIQAFFQTWHPSPPQTVALDPTKDCEAAGSSSCCCDVPPLSGSRSRPDVQWDLNFSLFNGNHHSSEHISSRVAPPHEARAYAGHRLSGIRDAAFPTTQPNNKYLSHGWEKSVNLMDPPHTSSQSSCQGTCSKASPRTIKIQKGAGLP